MIIAWLLQQSQVPAPSAGVDSISLISVRVDEPAAAAPPPPAPPAKIFDTFKPITEISMPDVVPATNTGNVGSSCTAQDAVLKAILLDPAAVEAIRKAPAEVRSIADAIVIWNEGWNLQVVDPATSLHRVRDIVEQSLLALPQMCLDQEVTGPRLLPIPDADGLRMTIIVIGSGTWKWQSLLAPAMPQVLDPAVPVDTGPQSSDLLKT